MISNDITWTIRLIISLKQVTVLGCRLSCTVARVFWVHTRPSVRLIIGLMTLSS